MSFVGVDVNTASLCLLKKVAGLTEGRAKSIIQRRKARGPFTDRQELLKIKGIGAKTFEQCAGFVRVLPETALISGHRSLKGFEYLDQTWIHPESYALAKAFLKKANCEAKFLGSDEFVQKVEAFAGRGFEALARMFKTEASTMEVIVNGLKMKRDEDIRVKCEKPLFRKNLKGIEDLSPGVSLSGEVGSVVCWWLWVLELLSSFLQVRNVTHFGVFVDVGVSRDGLLLMQFTKGRTLSIGQKVQVKVHTVDKPNNKFTLALDE